MDIKKLLKQYDELPYIEKRVLQLNVFARSNITRTDFLKIINQSDLKIALGKQYNNISITPIIDSLNSKKLMQQNNCNVAILHYVLIDGTSGEYSKENISSISSVLNKDPNLVDQLRCGIYLNNIALFEQAIKKVSINNHKRIILHLTSIYSAISLDDDWINRLLPEIQYWVIASKIYFILHGNYISKNQDIVVIKQIIDTKLDSWIIHSDFVLDIFLDFFLLNGDIDNIRYLARIVPTNSVKHHAILGILDFLEDNTNKALVNFDIAIKAIKETSKKRNVSLSGIYGICHILSLLKNDNSSNLGQTEDLIKNYKALAATYDKDIGRFDRYYYERDSLPDITRYFIPEHRSSYNLLMVLTNFLKLGSSRVDQEISAVLKYIDKKLDNALDRFILFLVLYWTQSKEVDLKQYSLDLHKTYDGTLLGIESVIKRYLDSIDKDSSGANNKDLSSRENSYIPYNFDFTAIIRVKPEWERAFTTLLSHFDKHGNVKKNDINDIRLVWMVYPRRRSDIVIPFEQKKLANGSWNKGRPISLKRLSENQRNLDYLNQFDHLAIKSIERPNSYYSNNHCINNDKALLALTDHTLIFDGDTGDHIELIKTSPELVVKEGKNNYLITLSTYSDTNKVTLQKEGENRYQVVEISQPILEIMKILGKNGVSVPKSEKERILSLIKSAASNISIRTELNTQEMDTVPGDSTLIVQLILVEDILKLRLFVRPFSGKGSYYKPAKGSTNIVAQIDNIYKSVTRDFTKERDNVTKLLDQCQTLSEQDNNDYEWKIDELETSLEILYELNGYKSKNPNNITIEWSHGQSIFLDRELSFDHLKLNIEANNQWFTFNGEIEIKEDQVMEMRDLLTKLNQSKGRFIELGNKRFIALTKSFAKRLQELNIASKEDGDNYNIHKLGAPLLLEFADKSKNVKTDSKWRGHIDKISSIEKHDPIISNNLQAELRPYQMEGFKWLARLTNLGFGACLADDMGLGKTVQTIALLLEQATIGPCLVVAPASVCYVWEEECKKFAPSLNCISIATTSDKRAAQINNLTKMDVLICSYGILYQIEDLLINKTFQVVVIDEAQAIKNFNTKRFKIITQLNTSNRIALSGTPIENRTEELWNLFEFLNPGFLGSRQLFQQKYTKPIELDKNITVRNTLKRLIQPFILRRIKSKVLDELPPKIEQTIFIEPTNLEKNFYEALRRESVERINNLAEASEAQKRFSILAEITKLRRACCDSSLVDDKIELPNSKLEALDEIINELKENNHRALVFSQYVGYLSIVRKRLDAKNIRYQYLDGSNTQKQRQNSVEAFQSGEGDLFLISLKAGGVGLNLTSADYVIHLDPWWNPAIEDQASDRAHRIGQTRPVTIYRLVMKYSIEEKILKMHHDKRELAISLLSDSDKSASLNQNDLLELITTSYVTTSSYNVTDEAKNSINSE